MKLTRKLTSLVIAGSLGFTALISGATYAYYQSIASSTGNTFETGTLKVTSTREDIPITGPMFYTFDDINNSNNKGGIKGTGYWEPDMSVSRIMFVQNTGSLDSYLRKIQANFKSGYLNQNSINKTNTELNAFSNDTNVTISVVRDVNNSTDVTNLMEKVTAANNAFKDWLKDNKKNHPDTQAKLFEMHLLYQQYVSDSGFPRGTEIYSGSLSNLRTGATFNEASNNIPLGHGESIALIYTVYLSDTDNNSQNAYQNLNVNFDFTHEFRASGN